VKALVIMMKLAVLLIVAAGAVTVRGKSAQLQLCDSQQRAAANQN